MIYLAVSATTAAACVLIGKMLGLYSDAPPISVDSAMLVAFLVLASVGLAAAAREATR